jgi:hypothetical protein
MRKECRKIYLLLLLMITISASSPLKVSSNIQLGEYYSIKDHPKAKGVNLKVKVPKGWEIMEGDRPNVVVKFLNVNDMFLVMVKNFETFVSKKNAKELFEDEEFISELTGAYNSQFKQWTLLDKKVVTIDNYPALELVVRGSGERVGVKFEMVMKTWYFFYEDKFIYLQGSAEKSNTWASKSQVFSMVANSVILLDQYN